MPKSVSSVTMNGVAFARALAYAYQACPRGDDTKLAQVMFIGDKVFCSDGTIWLVGLLPDDVQLPHAVVAARDSVGELIKGLDYFASVARRHGGGLFVHMAGPRIQIQVGSKKRTWDHDLVVVDVGNVPDVWTEPVAASAPQIDATAIPKLRCNHMSMAMKWHGDAGAFTLRRQGDGNAPLRADVEVDDRRVAVAFMLPTTHSAAVLPADEPLFEQAAITAGRQLGQSIADLQLDLRLATPAAPTEITIGGVKIDTTGLDDPQSLVRNGPCGHQQDGGPCAPCTQVAVLQAREVKARETAKVFPIGGKKGGKGGGGKRGPRKPRTH